jgi:hypothetical protein
MNYLHFFYSMKIFVEKRRNRHQIRMLFPARLADTSFMEAALTRSGFLARPRQVTAGRGA